MPNVNATIRVNVNKTLTELLRTVIDNDEYLQMTLEVYASTDSRGAAKRYWYMILEPFLYNGIDDWQRQTFLPVWSADVQDLIVELMEECVSDE